MGLCINKSMGCGNVDRLNLTKDQGKSVGKILQEKSRKNLKFLNLLALLLIIT